MPRRRQQQRQARAPRAAAPQAPPTPPGTMAAPTADTFARTIPFMYERHYYGESKKASMGQIEVGASASEEAATLTPEQRAAAKRRLSARKRILEGDKLRAIRHLDTEFRTFIQNAAACCWRPGLYLVPVGMVEVVDERAQTWAQQRAHLVDEAGEELAAMVLQAERDLRPAGQFNPMDYPTKERFKAAYWIAWRFIDLGVPNLLREVRAEVFERERAKVEQEGRRAVDMIQQHLRASLLDITNHLTGLLAKKDDGKWRTLRDGALDDLNQFLATVELRDVTEDGDLRRVVRRLRALGSGLDVEQLRDDDALRAATAAAMAEAMAALEPLVEERSRGIRLREEEEVA